MRASKRLRTVLLSAPLVVLAAGSCRAPGVSSGPGSGSASRSGSGSASRGEFLYGRYCAVCHGTRGTGDGLPEGTLFPAARDFGSGLFSIVSTENGVPTDTDLASVLRRGIPGSAMPSFSWMTGRDIGSLVSHVRELATAEMAVRVFAAAGGALTEEQARQQAIDWFTPGRTFDPPATSKGDTGLVQRGKDLYLSRCAACHGEQGTGRQPIVRWAGRRTIHWARDFTSGILKGGTSHRDLACRIQAGMPGSAMPPTTFASPQDLEAILAYLDTMIPADAGDRLVQKRQTIRVVRVQDPPLVLDDVRWAGLPKAEVVLSPLRWRADSIVHAEIRAAHDGASIYMLLSWADPTDDQPGIGESAPSDRAAVQLSDDPEATFFGMGSKRHPVTIWYWHPRPARQSAGVLDIVTAPHRTLSDVSPLVRLPVKAESVVSRGHESAGGFGAQDRAVSVAAKRRDGRWYVLFRRELAAGTAAGFSFARAARVRMAIAIWDGATSRSSSDKSFTIWHDLRLE